MLKKRRVVLLHFGEYIICWSVHYASCGTKPVVTIMIFQSADDGNAGNMILHTTGLYRIDAAVQAVRANEPRSFFYWRLLHRFQPERLLHNFKAASVSQSILLHQCCLSSSISFGLVVKFLKAGFFLFPDLVQIVLMDAFTGLWFRIISNNPCQPHRNRKGRCCMVLKVCCMFPMLLSDKPY